MSMFDPEVIFRKLLLAAGMTPETIMNTINGVLNEIEQFKREISAFKIGAGRMVARYDSKLDGLDQRLMRIETVLNILASELRSADALATMQRPINGEAIEHERPNAG